MAAPTKTAAIATHDMEPHNKVAADIAKTALHALLFGSRVLPRGKYSVVEYSKPRPCANWTCKMDV
jgi:hypothetical protein